jgi:hypothetical protein
MNLFSRGLFKKADKAPPKSINDGAISLSKSAFGLSQFDADIRWRNISELVEQYRMVSQTAECDLAISDIIDEAIVYNSEYEAITLDITRYDVNDKIKDAITEEFKNIIKIINFSDYGDEYFKKWYVDGRIFFHVEYNKNKGIETIEQIDSKFIQYVVEDDVEYYLFDDDEVKLKYEPENIIYSNSGIFDSEGLALSYLHKAIKPLNVLNMLEDAATVYRITRAPEKLVFYIDVGNLPKAQAEQYIKGIMTQYQNKTVYDPSTGTVKNGKHMVSMLEDYWIPRRDSSNTEISTLEASNDESGLAELRYFRTKVYKALHVPISRMEEDTGGGDYSFKREGDIERDEMRFSKFINKLRKRFSSIFYNILEIQLLNKNIITKEEWPKLKETISFVFQDDSYFVELKENSILKERIEMLNEMEDLIGEYYSKDYIRNKILKQSDELQKEIKQQNDDDSDIGIE